MGDTIRKSNRKKSFTTVNNDYLQDKILSWKAKGIITYVMSLPSNWSLNISDLKNRSKDGRDSTASGLRELIENGYCLRKMQRDTNGFFINCEYVVSDIKEFYPCTDNPQTENPFTDNPFTENPTLINTNSNKDLYKVNTNNNKAEKSFSASSSFEEKNKRKTLFRNSDVYKMVKFENNIPVDYSEFEKNFPKKDFDLIDLVYYFHVVSDWSDQRTIKRTSIGWLATVRSFIRRDIEAKKLHLKKEHENLGNQFNYSGAMNFLNEYD